MGIWRHSGLTGRGEGGLIATRALRRDGRGDCRDMRCPGSSDGPLGSPCCRKALWGALRARIIREAALGSLHSPIAARGGPWMLVRGGWRWSGSFPRTELKSS